MGPDWEKWATNRVKQKRGQFGGQARVNPPKMLGLTEMSNVGGGWAKKRAKRAMWKKCAEEGSPNAGYTARVTG